MTADRILAVGLDGKAHFIGWGPIQISVTNLVVIAVIDALFVSFAMCCRRPSRRARR